jgi:hypothetical protein
VIHETRQNLAEVEHNIDLLIDGDLVQPLVSQFTVTSGVSSRFRVEQKREEVQLERRKSDIECDRREVLHNSNLRELLDLFWIVPAF